MNRENAFAPIYKSCNSGTNQEKYELISAGVITVPRYLDIELTNFCNFNCCFCPTGTHSMKRTRGYMSDDVVNAIIENVKKYKIPGVRFIRWGEPTLHPNWLGIIRKFKEAGVVVHMNTNGSLLNDESLQQIVDMQMDSIKFSFQGADEGTYNEMRKSGDYKKLLSTVRKLYAIRGDKPFPYIQISTTLTGETLEQIESFKKDIAAYCDYYNIGYTKLTHLNVDEMDIDENEKEKIRNLQKRETNEHSYISICPEAFDKLSINWNGDVTLCCSDYDNFMLIGNILDSNLQQLFLSHAADNYRKIVAQNQYNKIHCCSICYSTVPLTK